MTTLSTAFIRQYLFLAYFFILMPEILLDKTDIDCCQEHDNCPTVVRHPVGLIPLVGVRIYYHKFVLHLLKQMQYRFAVMYVTLSKMQSIDRGLYKIPIDINFFDYI